MKTVLTLAAAAAVAVTTLSAQVGHARSGVKTGVLKCNVEGGVGFVFGSSRNINCIYTPSGSGRTEYYVGQINRYGVDIGYIKEGTMLWAVVAPTKNVKAGALAGNYGGISADIAAGYGVGANALIGGFDKSVALQPLSIEGIKGLNIAAGIAELKLRAK